MSAVPDNTPRAGRSVPNPTLYSPANIKRYRRLVVQLSHSLAWKVDNEAISDLYALHMAPTHLEVGPADGHFLLRAPDPAGPLGEPVPAKLRQIHLLDLNDGPLDHCAPLLNDRGLVIPHKHDVLNAPWPLDDASVGSVAAFHVAHCVPGPSLRHKAPLFSEPARVLGDEGVFIGSTLPGVDDPYTRNNWLARRLQTAYNKPGRNTFHNTGDRFVDLRAMLDLNFTSVDLREMGAGAAWVAKGPRR